STAARGSPRLAGAEPRLPHGRRARGDFRTPSGLRCRAKRPGGQDTGPRSNRAGKEPKAWCSTAAPSPTLYEAVTPPERHRVVWLTDTSRRLHARASLCTDRPLQGPETRTGIAGSRARPL